MWSLRSDSMCRSLSLKRHRCFSIQVGLLQGSQAAVVGRLLVGTAAPVAEVVDTTGAGDAFIGGITYGRGLNSGRIYCQNVVEEYEIAFPDFCFFVLSCFLFYAEHRP